VFIRREDAERFIAEVRGDDPEVAAKLRIEERELARGRDCVCEGPVVGGAFGLDQQISRSLVVPVTYFCARIFTVCVAVPVAPPTL
jgi:hypothetical protein